MSHGDTRTDGCDDEDDDDDDDDDYDHDNDEIINS